jgi:hypothetical protein
MSHISIRDLQKMSAESIGALPGPTPVKSGDRTVGLLVPLKAADPDRLAAVLTRLRRSQRDETLRRTTRHLLPSGRSIRSIGR